MELRVNEPGLFIEELVFQIRPELVKRYVELEYEIMAKELAGLDGFCGWQIWVSETNPGRVTSGRTMHPTGILTRYGFPGKRMR